MCIPAVFADTENTAGVTFKLETDRYNVTVSGKYADNGRVLIVVKDEGNNTVAFEQCDVVNNLYSKSFYMAIPTVSGVDYAEYTAYLGHSVSSAELKCTFKLPTSYYYTSVIDKLKNAADAATVVSLIDSNKDLLGLDVTYFKDPNKTAIANKFIAMDRSGLTASNVLDVFNECIIRSYVYEIKTEAEDVIKHYDSMLGIVNGTDTMYAEYSNMTAEQKANVLSKLSENEVTVITDLKTVFNMSVLSETLDTGLVSDAGNLLAKYEAYLNIGGYSNLDTTKQAQLIGLLQASDIPLTVSEFSSLYTTLLVQVNGSGGGGSSSGGLPTGGGGAAGGGGSVGEATGYTDPVVNTEIVVNEADYATDVFSDLGGYEWAAGAVNNLAAKGIVNGRTSGVFAPGEYITREEFAKILTLAYGIYDENAKHNFADVESGRWSEVYIASIYKSGAVTGYPDGTFGCNRPITREELAVMIYRVLNKNIGILAEGDVKINFNDFSSVSDYAKNSVQILAANGIINGDDAGNFNPQNNATRAEVCTLIYRAFMQGGDN